MITLIIIGVVAALTIPNLMQKYQEQATVKKVQKFYSNISNAYSLAIKENGKPEEWGLTGNDNESKESVYTRLFKPYFKITKNCGVTSSNECFSSTRYKFLNKTIGGNSIGNSTYYKILLDDGSAVSWYVLVYASGNIQIVMIYDINGPKGPNQWGKDYFYFASDLKGKIIPFGLQNAAGYPFERYCKTVTEESYSGYGCTGWVIYKGNMDYLHCDDLSWTGKDKCK